MQIEKHDSMRGWFAYELYKQMELNPKIILLTGDLGYAMFDYIKRDFPDRFLNVGAAEQTLLDVACGLALEGKIPFAYSITTFLLYRGFETIRTYINHEKLNVKLVGGGRDKDYAHDGISHWSEDAWKLFENWPAEATTPDGLFQNIKAYWPETKEEVPQILDKMIKFKGPDFISLRR